ncbi:hypothetical protein PRSY57_1411700, partial [Plasmodium reichenowi]
YKNKYKKNYDIVGNIYSLNKSKVTNHIINNVKRNIKLYIKKNIKNIIYNDIFYYFPCKCLTNILNNYCNKNEVENQNENLYSNFNLYNIIENFPFFNSSMLPLYSSFKFLIYNCAIHYYRSKNKDMYKNKKKHDMRKKKKKKKKNYNNSNSDGNSNSNSNSISNSNKYMKSMKNSQNPNPIDSCSPLYFKNICDKCKFIKIKNFCALLFFNILFIMKRIFYNYYIMINFIITLLNKNMFIKRNQIYRLIKMYSSYDSMESNYLLIKQGDNTKERLKNLCEEDISKMNLLEASNTTNIIDTMKNTYIHSNNTQEIDNNILNINNTLNGKTSITIFDNNKTDVLYDHIYENNNIDKSPNYNYYNRNIIKETASNNMKKTKEIFIKEYFIYKRFKIQIIQYKKYLINVFTNFYYYAIIELMYNKSLSLDIEIFFSLYIIILERINHSILNVIENMEKYKKKGNIENVHNILTSESIKKEYHMPIFFYEHINEEEKEIISKDRRDIKTNTLLQYNEGIYNNRNFFMKNKRKKEITLLFNIMNCYDNFNNMLHLKKENKQIVDNTNSVVNGEYDILKLYTKERNYLYNIESCRKKKILYMYNLNNNDENETYNQNLFYHYIGRIIDRGRYIIFEDMKKKRKKKNEQEKNKQHEKEKEKYQEEKEEHKEEATSGCYFFVFNPNDTSNIIFHSLLSHVYKNKLKVIYEKESKKKGGVKIKHKNNRIKMDSYVTTYNDDNNNNNNNNNKIKMDACLTTYHNNNSYFYDDDDNLIVSRKRNIHDSESEIKNISFILGNTLNCYNINTYIKRCINNLCLNLKNDDIDYYINCKNEDILTINLNETICVYIFFPLQFHYLRKLLCDKEEDFMKSLKKSNFINFDHKKRHFVKTYDDRFIIKEINKYEFKSFINKYKEFFQYFSDILLKKKKSLLCYMYGLYQIEIKKRNKKNMKTYIILENVKIENPNSKILIFDIKGARKKKNLQKLIKQKRKTSFPFFFFGRNESYSLNTCKITEDKYMSDDCSSGISENLKTFRKYMHREKHLKDTILQERKDDECSMIYNKNAYLEFLSLDNTKEVKNKISSNINDMSDEPLSFLPNCEYNNSEDYVVDLMKNNQVGQKKEEIQEKIQEGIQEKIQEGIQEGIQEKIQEGTQAKIQEGIQAKIQEGIQAKIQEEIEEEIEQYHNINVINEEESNIEIRKDERSPCIFINRLNMEGLERKPREDMNSKYKNDDNNNNEVKDKDYGKDKTKKKLLSKKNKVKRINEEKINKMFKRIRKKIIRGIINVCTIPRIISPIKLYNFTMKNTYKYKNKEKKDSKYIYIYKNNNRLKHDLSYDMDDNLQRCKNENVFIKEILEDTKMYILLNRSIFKMMNRKKMLREDYRKNLRNVYLYGPMVSLEYLVTKRFCLQKKKKNIKDKDMKDICINDTNNMISNDNKYKSEEGNVDNNYDINRIVDNKNENMDDSMYYYYYYYHSFIGNDVGNNMNVDNSSNSIEKYNNFTIDNYNSLKNYNVLFDDNFRDYIKSKVINLEYNDYKYLMDSLNEDTNFLCSQDIMDYSLLIHIDIHNYEIIFKIIDYLRPYTWDKSVENFSKSVLYLTKGYRPTIIQSEYYKKRFLSNIKKYVFYYVPIYSFKKKVVFKLSGGQNREFSIIQLNKKNPYQKYFSYNLFNLILRYYNNFYLYKKYYISSTISYDLKYNQNWYYIPISKDIYCKKNIYIFLSYFMKEYYIQYIQNNNKYQHNHFMLTNLINIMKSTIYENDIKSNTLDSTNKYEDKIKKLIECIDKFVYKKGNHIYDDICHDICDDICDEIFLNNNQKDRKEYFYDLIIPYSSQEQYNNIYDINNKNIEILYPYYNNHYVEKHSKLGPYIILNTDSYFYNQKYYKKMKRQFYKRICDLQISILKKLQKNKFHMEKNISYYIQNNVYIEMTNVDIHYTNMNFLDVFNLYNICEKEKNDHFYRSRKSKSKRRTNTYMYVPSYFLFSLHKS